ncbi:hypothetical protein ACIRLA_15690 [Streptomyces sp. NPDC102364]|uniref:hypothetical protein n=1 Tax=Streptomyces sp. NPDC102364 TaxID=3366161 RepID=UPI00382ABB81
MNQQPEPDVAFGLHSDLGVAAATADDRPFLDEVLRKHHFRYAQAHDVYLLPSDIPHTNAVRTVASATRDFQRAGLSVAAAPKLLSSPFSSTTVAALPSMALEPSVHALADRIHHARQAKDVSDVLGEVLHDRHGTFVRLDELLQAASVWCERLGTPSGHELTVHFRSLRHNLAYLGQQLAGFQTDLAVFPEPLAEGVPTLKENPVWECQDRPVSPTPARTQAAVAPSPHRSPGDPGVVDVQPNSPGNTSAKPPRRSR